MRSPLFLRCAAVGVCFALAAAHTLALDVDIQSSSADFAELNQFPPPPGAPAGSNYLGWVPYLDTSVPTRVSIWGDPQKTLTGGRTNAWVGNPDMATLAAPDNQVIRTSAHANTSTSAVLEDKYVLGAGVTQATLSAVFRANYTNNTTATGVPALSLQLGSIGGPGVSLNIGDKDYNNPPNHSAGDRYWYQLVQYREDISGQRLLYGVQIFPLQNPAADPSDPANKTLQSDPNYHSVKLALTVFDATHNRVQLWWDGALVFSQQVDPFPGNGQPDSFGLTSGSVAAWGSDTSVQPLPGLGGSGSELQVYWHEIRLQDVGICATPFADADRDGDVDMNDFAVFQLCYTVTAGIMPATAHGYPCTCLDRDQNGLIDQGDFAQFANCATRDGLPWSQALTPNCVP